MSYVRCSAETHRRLKIAAAAVGLPMQELLDHAVSHYLQDPKATIKDEKNSSLIIPQDVAPVVEWIIDFWSRHGSHEQEALKASLNALTAQRAAEVRRLSASKKNAS